MSILNEGRASSGWKDLRTRRERALEWHVSQLAAKGIRIAENLVCGNQAEALGGAISLLEMLNKIKNLDDAVDEKRRHEAAVAVADLAKSSIPDATGTYGIGGTGYDKGVHADVRR